ARMGLALDLLDLRHLGHERVIGCYLLETPDGPALFDCGPATCVPQLKEGLRERGLELTDLRHLLLSHIHLDHAGAAGVLVREHPGLQVHVSEIGDPHLTELRGRLAAWSELVRDGAGEEEFVAAAAQELGPEGDTYEHAMPLWQSYAGLARYWEKATEAGRQYS